MKAISICFKQFLKLEKGTIYCQKRKCFTKKYEDMESVKISTSTSKRRILNLYFQELFHELLKWLGR